MRDESRSFKLSFVSSSLIPHPSSIFLVRAAVDVELLKLQPAAARLLVDGVLRALEALAVGEQLARAVAVEVEMIDENFGEEAARPGPFEGFRVGQVCGLQLIEVRQRG